MTYLAYAGVGSRQTPNHILVVMRHIGAYLASEGWTLRSGGAEGADTAFELGVGDQMGDHSGLAKEIYLPWAGFNFHESELHPRNIPFSEQEMKLSGRIHPAWNKCSPSAKLMHQRNLRQMVGHQSVCGANIVASKFVVCWTEGGQLKGGTAQAIRIAVACDIPIVNLGRATTAQELEAMVLEVDRLQNQYKEKPADAPTQAAPQQA